MSKRETDSENRRPDGKVLLIGWDAADWKVIGPLLDAGKMPNLEELIQLGVCGNSATLYPSLSPMLWTSIATGKRPFKHGILGFTEPDPDLGGIRPITNLSRKTKAIWNILSQNGMKSNVIGWWPSHPAEPIDGVMVSNRYQKVRAPMDEPWSLQLGTVHPRRLEANIAALRCHPQQLNSGHIHPFVPRFAEIDQEQDRRLDILAKIISECLSIEAAALALMHFEPWDLTCVYFDGIDHFCHGFMRYHPPRREDVSEEDFELFREVVDSAYILHDIMLGRLMEKAGPDTAIVLVSDHGFHSGSLRPLRIPREPAGPAVMHRHYGIFVMRGPGVKADERIYGAGILDVCPTILCLLGLPVGLDMDGKVLVDAFERKPAIHTIPSHDAVEGPAGMHAPDMKIDPSDAREAIEQLVALGYIEKPSEDAEEAAGNAVRELRYNLARSYMDAGGHVEAIPILEELFQSHPHDFRFGIQLVACYQAVNWLADARRALESIFRSKEEELLASREKLMQFLEKHKEKSVDEMSEEEAAELAYLRMKASSNPLVMDYLMGSLLFSEGDADAALEHLRRAESSPRAPVSLHLKIGTVYLQMKRWGDAEVSFMKALGMDPDCAEAHRGLAFSYLRRSRNGDAAGAALDAVGRIYFDPLSHFVLGVALHRLGEIPRAIEALKVAVSQNPHYAEAHRRLSTIYRTRLGDIENAARHHAFAQEAARRNARLRRKKTDALPKPADSGEIRDDSAGTEPGSVGTIAPPGETELSETIIIVSGLPRSGTSMMMQMLSAGGAPVLTDDKRAPDALNPRGYFELEPVKSLQRDNSWLPEAKGKAVKIVAQLLPYIAPDFKYRVIFMERGMEEILESQDRMLRVQAGHGNRAAVERLGRTFAAQVASVKKMLAERGIPVLLMRYETVIAKPQEAAAQINGFLGGKLNQPAMAVSVEPALRTVIRKETPDDFS